MQGKHAYMHSEVKHTAHNCTGAGTGTADTSVTGTDTSATVRHGWFNTELLHRTPDSMILIGTLRVHLLQI
jgi:hypothetical protein